jgi:2-oxoglutaroyl-CoA hydrolase
VIAAIEKYAFGVGFELCLACDFRFATEDALVGLPESAIGQMPGSGGSARVVRLIGMTRAKDMVMLGKRVPAPEGKDIGLITDVAADGEALTEMVTGYAAKLNALAPLSMRSLKRVLNSALDSPLSVALDVEGHSYEKLRWTEDYIEGINAFSERRKPYYKGE